MRAIGIDPGSSALRFVELEKTTEGTRLVSAVTVPTNLFADDTPNAERAIAEASALLDKYGSAGLTYGRGVTGLTGRELILRYFKVPVGTEARQKLSIQFEIDEITNHGTEDVAFDHVMLPTPEDSLSDEDTVLVAMARNEFVDRQLDRLKELHVKPSRLMPSSLGLFNSWMLGGESQEGETVMLAHIGYAETELCLINDTALIFARNVNNGGKNFAEAAAEHLGVDTARAWKGLMKNGDMSPPAPGRRDGDAVQVVLWGVGDQFYRLLDSSVNFARLQLRMRGLNVSRVLLTGEMLRVKGFIEYMGTRFKQPVEAFDPFSNIVSKKVPDACRRGDGDPVRYPHQYSVAAGLARAALEPDTLGVTLETRTTIERRKFLHGSLFLYAGALAAMLMMALLILSQGDLNTEIDGLRKKAASNATTASSEQQKYDSVRDSYETLAPLAGSAYAAMEPTFQWLQVMREVRTFGNANDEMIVHSVAMLPPDARTVGVRDPHRVVIVLYFEDKGGTKPLELYAELKETLSRECRDILAESSPLNDGEGTPVPAAADGLPGGWRFELQITLRPHNS